MIILIKLSIFHIHVVSSGDGGAVRTEVISIFKIQSLHVGRLQRFFSVSSPNKQTQSPKRLILTAKCQEFVTCLYSLLRTYV